MGFVGFWFLTPIVPTGLSCWGQVTAPRLLPRVKFLFCFAFFFFSSSEKRVAFYITVLFWEAVFPESCNHSRRKVEKLINLLVNQKRKTDYS